MLFAFSKSKAKKTCLEHVIKNNPITGLDRPGGFQEVEASRF
jgi:hypothetical protein